MKISLKGISDFLGKDVMAAAETLKRQLPLAGIEVGAVQHLAEGLGKVVVGYVKELQKHPQADRLNVCQVVVQEGQAPLQIVCGAANVRAGQKVPVALVGAVLPGDFKIQAAKIRGVDSSGMICSKKELRLGEDSEGILVLADSAPVGSLLVDYLGLNDQVWEIELTPDRADCLSHLGMAREMGRLMGARPQLPEMDEIVPHEGSDVPVIGVEIQATKVCPVYGAQVFEGVTQNKSPEWLVRNLERLGLRSHSCLVDISNFVLMELGHPLHAFDADKIVGSKILVRFAKNGEKLTTLDAVERTLTADDLVIADLEKPLALAGVMGGLESAVTETTKRVLLESALFEAAVVQKMAQRHKIHSDSSHRFERGVDPQGLMRAAGRASLLIRQLTGARKRGSYFERRGDKAEKLFQAHAINLDLRAFNNTVGVEMLAEEAQSILSAAGIKTTIKSANVVTIEVPSYRLDIQREIDMIEELARLMGFDKIPVIYPPQLQASKSLTREAYRFERWVRRRFLEKGLTEMMPYCFISRSQRDAVPQSPVVELAKPLSSEWVYMRPNLFFGLTSVLANHCALGQYEASFFEAGRVYSPKEISVERPKGAPPEVPIRESFHAAWALMGHKFRDHWSTDKTSRDRKSPIDYFDAKGVLDRLKYELAIWEGRWGGLQFVELKTVLDDPKARVEVERQGPWIPLDWLHPTRSALVCFPGKGLGEVQGYVGEVHPSKKSDLLNLPAGFQVGVSLGEIRLYQDLMVMMKESAEGKLTQPNARGKVSLSRRIPIVERDFAFVLKTPYKSAELERALTRAAGPAVLDLRCVDVFPLESNEVSVAYRIQLQGESKALEDAEIQKICQAAIDTAKDKFGARLR